MIVEVETVVEPRVTSPVDGAIVRPIPPNEAILIVEAPAAPEDETAELVLRIKALPAPRVDSTVVNFALAGSVDPMPRGDAHVAPWR